MKRNTQSILFLSILALGLVSGLSSCVENTKNSKRFLASSNSKTGTTQGSGSGATVTTIGSGADTIMSTRVELTHFVDPLDGTYKKKITIPRNYRGFIYIAGLNVTALKDKILKVRFNIGRDRQPLVLNATIGKAPGITPQTDIEVLAVDFTKRPFLKTRLPYDLYDYTNYADASNALISDNRSGELYCRGLKAEDDPTFIATQDQATCSASDSRCLYSYAKVVDSTFYGGADAFSSIPTKTNSFTTNGSSYSLAMLRNTCLPDSNQVSDINTAFKTNFSGAIDRFDFYPYADESFTTLSPLQYTYMGPFRSINLSEWELSGDAITSSGQGLFENCTASGICTGSYLFPRQGKFDQTSGYKYVFGSSDRFLSTRSYASVSPLSQYVDGCNIRVQNYNSTTGLGIGSCNVTATIELFYEKDGTEYLVTKDNTLKLQLVRDSLTNADGKEVLYTAFKNCSSSAACGSSECCFNNRCWSKDLVTQCIDEVPGTGNYATGSTCRTDYECGSLCCDQSTMKCSPHTATGSNPVLCSKSPGQQCVSREYCRKEFVQTCKVYKDPDFATSQKCSVRCLAVETYSDCTNGICTAPAAAAPPGDHTDAATCQAAPYYQ